MRTKPETGSGLDDAIFNIEIFLLVVFAAVAGLSTASIWWLLAIYVALVLGGMAGACLESFLLKDPKPKTRGR